MMTRGNTRVYLFNNSIAVWIPPLLLSVVIFYFSSLPESVIQLPPVRLIDKMIHASVYGVLNYLVLRGCRKIGGDQKAFYAGIMYSILFGFSDEVHQYYTPGRFADPFDYFADVIGVLVSSWLFLKFRAFPKEARGDDEI